LSYEAGTSLQALGDQLGVDKNTVGRELKQAGITIRPRRGASCSDQAFLHA